MNYDKEPELSTQPVKPERPRLVGWLVIVGLLLAIGGAVSWQAGRWSAGLTPEQNQKADQVAVLEEQIVAMRAKLAALPGDATLRVRRQLAEEAVARQRALMRLREPPAPADSVELGEWQALLDDAVAAEQEYASRGMEADAMDYRRQDRVAVAVEKFRDALRLQREINRGPARSRRDLAREAHLQQQIEALVADPLLAGTRRALADARVAADAGRWAEAARLYTRAREIQQQLNAGFPRSRYSDPLAEEKIEAELRALHAVQAQAELGDYLQQAAAAAAAGRWAEGDRLYGLAAAQQKLINARYPQSRFVSVDQLEHIEAERQTLRLAPRLAELRRMADQMAVHLRRREVFQAQRLVAPAVELVEDMSRQLPKARGFDEELDLRLMCLGRRADDFARIQDRTYALLLPLPGGEPPAALLRTELPQALYDVLMSDNPSRTAGPELPVDSLTRTEAMEFCRRLGWILGATVRLPTAQECRRAAKEPEFASLAGGPDEWLGGGNLEATTAPLLGADGVVRPAPHKERAPTTSFRVVVEIDLLATPAK